jgi:hypothetical protein
MKENESEKDRELERIKREKELEKIIKEKETEIEDEVRHYFLLLYIIIYNNI